MEDSDDEEQANQYVSIVQRYEQKLRLRKQRRKEVANKQEQTKIQEVEEKYKERKLDIDLKINEAIQANNEGVKLEQQRSNDPLYYKKIIQ